MPRKPRLVGDNFLGEGAAVAQLGMKLEDGSNSFPNHPRFTQSEWDLSTTLGHLDLLDIVRLVRGKPPIDEDIVRYLNVVDLHPRNLASYLTPKENFEEHCSIVVDTRFCDPRTQQARAHWESPETAECLNNATVKVVSHK